jgi:hypothetical protein
MSAGYAVLNLQALRHISLILSLQVSTSPCVARQTRCSVSPLPSSSLSRLYSQVQSAVLSAVRNSLYAQLSLSLISWSISRVRKSAISGQGSDPGLLTSITCRRSTWFVDPSDTTSPHCITNRRIPLGLARALLHLEDAGRTRTWKRHERSRDPDGDGQLSTGAELHVDQG